MALIDIAPDERKNTRPMTTIEEEHARLIGSLMVCAKLLQAAEVCYRNGNREKVFYATWDAFLSLMNLHEGKGHRMEAETLALAGLLGFNIEQIYVAPPAGGVN